MVKIIVVDGQREIKIGTVKVRVKGRQVFELDHLQGAELSKIEQDAITSVYGDDLDVLENIIDLQTSIDIKLKEN